MEASDCVFELFGWRTVTLPVAKNRLPYFVPKTPGYTLFCQLAEVKRWRQAGNGDLLEGDVGVNDSITVSSA